MLAAIRRIRWKPFAPLAAIAAVITVWLAPITLLGKMPIGGDVTSFFLPLMSYYHRALRAGRIPLWNELWGFGFPCLAESQTGVFYPPHLVLFYLFEPETAYSLNIVLHFLLTGWFAYFCARQFDLKPWGATLAALTFAGNGFFIIHFPHQWSYTTGCWLPLAVGLAWMAMRRAEGRGPRAEGQKDEDRRSRIDDSGRWRFRAALGLALVLAVQMLAGHFQIAFYTQVIVLLMGVLTSLGALIARWRLGLPLLSHRLPHSALLPDSRFPTPHSPLCFLWIAVPVAFAFALAAVQLLPTYELIQTALPNGRDFEYLSGFANTPLHLVSYLLPTLFHVNPLWRPVAWDPFHTSPEECFSYVGLLPLCLALGAAWRWRREPRVRLWVLLSVITLLLSLGPYVPGFKLLIHVPGFSGFRAASRWSITTALFLALLTGFGLDQLRSVARLQSWMWRFGVVVTFVAIGCLAFIYLVLNGTKSRGATFMNYADTAWRFVSPWPNENGLNQIVARAEQTQLAPGLFELNFLGLSYRATPQSGDSIQQHAYGPTRTFSLQNERQHIATQEVLPPLLVLGLMGAFYWLRRKRSPVVWIPIALTIADVGAASWLRPTDFVPRGKLSELSPVLKLLATEPGQRATGVSMPNQAMLAGAGSLSAYRTVDLRSPSMLTLRSRGVSSQDRDTGIARNDARWTIYPGFTANWSLWPPSEFETEIILADPLLARIVFGQGWARAFPQSTSQTVVRRHVLPDASRAMVYDARLLEQQTAAARRTGPLDDNEVGRDRNLQWKLLQLPATPAKQLKMEPECEEFEFETEADAIVVLSEQTYPGWEATLTQNGVPQQVAVESVDSALRAVRVAAAGKYQLKLCYRSLPFERGWRVSMAALTLWIALALLTLVYRRTSSPGAVTARSNRHDS